jgi:hypothetical protein
LYDWDVLRTRIEGPERCLERRAHHGREALTIDPALMARGASFLHRASTIRVKQSHQVITAIFGSAHAVIEKQTAGNLSRRSQGYSRRTGCARNRSRSPLDEVAGQSDVAPLKQVPCGANGEALRKFINNLRHGNAVGGDVVTVAMVAIELGLLGEGKNVCVTMLLAELH